MRRSLKAVVVAGCTGSLLFGVGIFSTSESAKNGERAPASYSTVETPAQASVETQVTPQERTGAMKNAGNRTLWPRDGERWFFRFERKVSAEFNGRPWLTLKFGGRAVIEPAGTHGENRFYLLSFDADRFEMQGQSKKQTQKFPSLRAEMTPEGTLRELRVVSLGGGPSAVTEETKDAVKDLASQWLFFESESRLGKSEAKIETVSAVPGEEVYSKRVSSFPSRPEITRLDSVHEWAAVKDGPTGSRVARVEGTENFTVGSANGDFDQRTSYRWVWTHSEKISELTKIEVGESIRIAESSGSATETESAKARLERAEFRTTWAKVSSLSSGERLGFFERVRKALDAGQGELVSDIVSGVKGKTTTSLEWRTGVGILAASSNEAAQKALVTLYRETGNRTDEKLSILAGVTAGEGIPASEWKEVLSSELREASAQSSASVAGSENPTGKFSPKPYDSNEAVREASLFALGSAIRKETDPSRRRELESLLWREASDATTASSQATVLEAIGNSASREFYSYIRTQAGSAEPRVRAKAVGAVRFLASDLAKPILDAARADPSPVVRKAAEWSRKYVDSGL